MNYQIVLDETLKEIEKNNEKPKLLLHVCCAPCSSYVLEYLNKYFNITVFYYNPNISTKDEYDKRYNEEQRFVKEYPFENEIKVINGKYDNEKYEKLIDGFKDEKEGGARCFKCYRLRLEESAKYAKENNYDYFTTTLTISPYKNSKVLNEIGGIHKDGNSFNPGFNQLKQIADSAQIPLIVCLHPETIEVEAGKYNKQGQEIIYWCKKNNVLFISELDEGIGLDMYRDRIHTNEKGQLFEAHLMYKYLLPALNKRNN